MSKANQINMTEGSIVKNLLKFSIPIIFSNVLQLLFHAADVAVIGRFAGSTSLAAVGSVGSLVNLFVNLFVGISAGVNVTAGRSFGAKDSNKIQKIVHTSISLSIIFGIMITILGLTFSTPLLRLMHSPDDVLPLSATYLRIYFMGITATLIYNFCNALLNSKGDTKRGLYILVSAGILNLILNLLFVIKFKMDVAGVALATVISQVYSAVFIIILLIRETGDYHFSIKKLSLDIPSLGQIIKIGLPAGLQGVMFSISNIQIQSSINSFGTTLIAGNAAACSLEDFLYQSMGGFSASNLTFCSQNIGAKKTDRIKKGIAVSLLFTFATGVLLGALFLIFGRNLLGIYTQDFNVIESGMKRMIVIMPTIFICGFMHGLGNSIRGIGHSLMPTISITIGCCVFRVFWIAVIFPIFNTPFNIFVSYPISWFITSTTNLVFFLYYLKKMNSKV